MSEVFLIVSIHQPGYFSWLGLIDKIAKSDVFVILDNVQFNKRVYQNRTLIKTPNGGQLLTIPVLAKGHQVDSIKINELKIDSTQFFHKKHYNAFLYNYKSSKYWGLHENFLNNIYIESPTNDFLEIALKTLFYTLEQLEIKAKVISASELNPTGQKSELILDICKKVGATRYLSGTGAKDYMDDLLFKRENIDVSYQEFVHPVYPQLHGDFLEGMGAIDLLMNCGPEAKTYLKN